MNRIREISEGELLEAVSHVLAGRRRCPAGGIVWERDTVIREATRRDFGPLAELVPPAGEMPRTPMVLELGEWAYLCPASDGAGGRCHEDLHLELRTFVTLSPDLELEKPLTVEFGDQPWWHVSCAAGHVLEVAPSDTNTSPPFRLGRFLTGESYWDLEVES